MGIAAIAVALFVGLAQTVPDVMHKTIFFCSAGFCIVHVLLLRVYGGFRGQSDATPVIQPPVTTQARAAQATEPSAAMVAVDNNQFTCEPFDLTVGSFWERRLHEIRTIRVELLEVGEAAPPNPDLDGAKPYVDVRMSGSGRLYTATLGNVSLGGDRFRLFREYSMSQPMVLHMSMTPDRLSFDAIIVDHINLVAKSTRLMYVSARLTKETKML